MRGSKVKRLRKVARLIVEADKNIRTENTKQMIIHYLFNKLKKDKPQDGGRNQRLESRSTRRNRRLRNDLRNKLTKKNLTLGKVRIGEDVEPKDSS